MGIKKHIPNFITLLNLLCGCIAVLCAVSSDFFLAALFVFAGIFFDFMDGLTARLLNVKSALGLQLDSLADMVTSGVVPGVVMFKLLTMSLGGAETISVEASWDQANYWHGLQVPLLAFLGFLITLSSAYRLAKFNLDEDQQNYFKGLPTPANTILIISLPLILEFQGSALYHKIILNPWFLIGLTLLSSYLLNSRIKLFALKFSDWSFKSNGIRYVFIVCTLILIVLFKFVSVPIILLFYILLSLITGASGSFKTH